MGLIVEGSLRLSPKMQRSEQITGAHFSLMSPAENYIYAGVQAFGGIYRTGRRVVFGGALPHVFARRYDAIIRDFDKVAAYFAHKIIPRSDRKRRTWLLKAEVEPLPNRESRVTLADQTDHYGRPNVHVNWQTTERDRLCLNRAIQILDGELVRSGIGRAHSLIGQSSWELPYFVGNHHSGTTRMHQDPRRGAVDASCRVHDAPNLFVMGSSLFPTIGTAPPTFTIICLTLRLADYLTRQLRSVAVSLPARPLTEAELR